MPSIIFDFDKFKTLSKKNGIKLYFAKERSGGEFEVLRLGFGGFNEIEFKYAVRELAKIWYNCVKQVGKGRKCSF
jgi:GntR family transcriptional regulator/MocR family aminotransferase